ncbi:hypothetical protein BVY00_01980, partial [bacterium G20]
MAVSIDQQFVEYIVKSVVGHPDEVKIERRIDEKGVLLELSVNPEDLGRVIGKRGATAQSIRTLLRALGTKNDARYNLKIIDTGDGRPGAQGQSSDAPTAQADEPVASDNSTPTDAPVPKPTAASAADDIDMTEDDLPKTPKEHHSDVVSRTRK